MAGSASARHASAGASATAWISGLPQLTADEKDAILRRNAAMFLLLGSDA